jgi:hypothetical protein
MGCTVGNGNICGVYKTNGKSRDDKNHSETKNQGEFGESGKVSMKRRSEKRSMAEKRKCEYCEKDAIGYQGFACCSAYVCLDHADSFVLALKPGEKLTSGECYFERFSVTD